MPKHGATSLHALNEKLAAQLEAHRKRNAELQRRMHGLEADLAATRRALERAEHEVNKWRDRERMGKADAANVFASAEYLRASIERVFPDVQRTDPLHAAHLHECGDMVVGFVSSLADRTIDNKPPHTAEDTDGPVYNYCFCNYSEGLSDKQDLAKNKWRRGQHVERDDQVSYAECDA